jgi:hypothetical protein
MSDRTLTEETRLSDEEYMRRLRARLIECGGEGSDAVAEAVAVDAWREDFDNDPEGAADEEMTYWEDDGDE